jgi:hypothetical protein
MIASEQYSAYLLTITSSIFIYFTPNNVDNISLWSLKNVPIQDLCSSRESLEIVRAGRTVRSSETHR